MIFTLSLGFSIFFSMAYQTFSEDKKLFVLDLNQSVMKTAVSDSRAELKSRIDELQTLLPKIYDSASPRPAQLFRELSLQHLPQELLGVHFYRRQLSDGTVTLLSHFKNTELFNNKSLPETTLDQIETNYALPLEKFSFSAGVSLINRSLSVSLNNRAENLAVLTFLIPGSFVNDNTQSIIIVVDILQDFLRKKLSQSELAEVFLIKKWNFRI